MTKGYYMLMIDKTRPPKSELIRMRDAVTAYGLTYRQLRYYIEQGVLEHWMEGRYRYLVRKADCAVLAEELGITPPAQPEPRDDGD